MKNKKINCSRGVTLEGPILIKPDIYYDKRGNFHEAWNNKKFNELIGKDINFVQDNESTSIKGVIRGLHFQKNPLAQGKLIRVLNGSIYDVIVDIRSNSNTFRSWSGVFLNDDKKEQLWIPEGFAHGFLVLSDFAKIVYKVTNFWTPDLERTLLWNDKFIDIQWPLNSFGIQETLLSDKDKEGLHFKDLSNKGELF